MQIGYANSAGDHIPYSIRRYEDVAKESKHLTFAEIYAKAIAIHLRALQ